MDVNNDIKLQKKLNLKHNNIKRNICGILKNFKIRDTKFEEEYDLAIKSIPREQLLKIKNEKLFKTRFWCAFVITVLIFVSHNYFEEGSISQNQLWVIVFFEIGVLLVLISTVFKIGLVIVLIISI